MPNYNAQVPYSIFSGDVAPAFNNEAPAAAQSSQQFALPSYAGFPENGRTVTGVSGNFLRVKVSATSGGSGVTVRVLG